ncbi:MAG: sugar transferase (PEP-CTERM/EpsH1 system associated) [Paraglaciecola sp.]
MNIVILAHRVPFPANKGEKIRTFHQLELLAKQGHNIHLFAPYDAPGDLSFFDELKRVLPCQVSAFELPSKPYRMIMGMVKGDSLSESNFYSHHLQQHFDQSLLAERPDIVMCTASSMAPYLFNSKTLKIMSRKPKLLMDFMDVDSDKWRQYAESSRWPMRWIYQREQKLVAACEKKIATEFDECYLIAAAEVALFKQQVTPTDNVKVLGNGLDTRAFYPAKNKHRNHAPVFLFTGVMDYKPNVDAVVWFVQTCWKQILQLHPDAKFIIAGMTPNKEVNKLTAFTGVQVTGFVEDILPYYHQADIFVAPFRLARGVQNKVLQAFSCGLAVVSTPMGAEGIACNDQEHLLLANCAEDFLAKIASLVDDPALSASLGSNALSLIEKQYSWEGQLQPLINAIGKEI